MMHVNEAWISAIQKIIHTILVGILFVISSGCGSDSAATATVLTLDNCTTSVAAGVPAFYSKYFKCSTITISGTNIVIKSDGLPPHLTAYYGSGHVNYTAFDTSGGKKQNPNTIKTQAIHFEFPVTPASRGLTIDGTLVDATKGTSDNEYKMGAAGVGLDSVALYNSLASPPDVITEEAITFDSYSAHADGSGEYHYHTTTAGPLEVIKNLGLNTSTTPESGAGVELYGIMCDGTVVMGCTELDGSAVGTPALDNQNGHIHDLLDAASMGLTGRYHVHVCPGTYTGHQFNPEIQYYDTCTSI